MALSQSALSELLEVVRAGGSVDVMREAMALVLQELIELEATQVIGAGRYERSEARVTHRNGVRICFYASNVGVVADAVITSAAELRPVEFAKKGTDYPWAFTVAEARFYFDRPVVLDPGLRSRLDAFAKQGTTKYWSWLVQGTRYVTAHDLAILTRTD